MAGYLPRQAERIVQAALNDTRIVVVNGARQAGKSTLVHAVMRGRHDALERRLDRPSELQGARSDPERFVMHDGLLVIDEIQRAPELVLPIKAIVDTSNKPGQFLLTGSARLLGLRALPDALVGRSETIELWPFSQGEIDGAPDGFVDAVFAGSDTLSRDGETDRDEYIERATRGGFPEAVTRSEGRRSRWFESYLNDLIDRDVTRLSDIQRRPDLDRLVRLLAGRMATPIVVENVANVLGVPKSTVDRYLALFEEVFLVKRIPPWSNSATTRASRQRKLLFVDTGLGAHLSGRTTARARKDDTLAGQLLENFVISEIARQLTWSSEYVRLHHYRARTGEEVDAVLESADGRVVGIEVKAASTAMIGDFRHLRHLERRIGKQFLHGFVLYTGRRAVPFGDRLTAIPLDLVWRAAAS